MKTYSKMKFLVFKFHVIMVIEHSLYQKFYLAELLSVLKNTHRCVQVCVSCGIPLPSVCRSTGVVRGLAAHVGIFDLHSEQGPVCTHTELVPLQAFVEVQITPLRGVWDA